MWGHWRAFLAAIMYSVLYRVCGLALHARVDGPSISIVLLIIRLTILSVNQIYIYFSVMLALLSVRKLEVIMRLTTWLVSALGMCFLHRPQYRISYPNLVIIPFHAPDAGHGSAGALVNSCSSGFSCHTRPRLDSIPCCLLRYCTVRNTARLILRRLAN